MHNIKNFVIRTITGTLFFILLESIYWYSLPCFCALLVLMFLEILMIEWPRLLPRLTFLSIAFTCVYPIIPMCSLLFLTLLYYNTYPLIPLYPLLVAWSADTGGYVAGKMFGYHKIYPSISPGKSWEGLAGSLGAIILCNLAVVYCFPAEQQISFFAYLTSAPFFIFVATLQTIGAFLGGTLISILKRRQGLKDTGSLIPGHGGLLDRFDSVFFVVILIWIMLGSC